MIQNNLDPDVAEIPRSWSCTAASAARAQLGVLRRDRRTLKPRRRRVAARPVAASRSAVFKTHADAPRVLIANSNLVPQWATWEHFNELDRKGLMMFGQMTAGSWIYIGSQGIVQGTTKRSSRRAAALRRRTGRQSGFSRGTGRHGRRPTACGDDGGLSMLAIECRQSRIDMRLRTGYLDLQRRASTRRSPLQAAA
jgi:urocanate hydratase